MTLLTPKDLKFDKISELLSLEFGAIKRFISSQRFKVDGMWQNLENPEAPSCRSQILPCLRDSK